MTERKTDRQWVYGTFVAAAVLIGLVVVLMPPGEASKVVPTDADAAQSSASEALPPIPDLMGPETAEEAPQREEVDELLTGIADPLLIQVRDTDGKPALGRTIAITSTGELPIWLIEDYQETDAEGRAVYDRRELQRIAGSNDWQEVIVGVWSWRARGFLAEQTVELSELREISFVVPSESVIFVQLVDFPKGFAPMLEAADGHAPEMDGVLTDSGWWRFQDVPHGHDWVIKIMRAELYPGRTLAGSAYAAHLPTQFVPGPAKPGDNLRVEYRLSELACILGRFVDENGEEFSLFKVEPTGLRAFAFGAHSHDGDAVLKIEALGGGNFVLIPSNATTSLSSFSRVHFDWQPYHFSWRARSQDLKLSEVPVRAATVLLPGTGPSMQLGDVMLRPDVALLEVLVEDETGAPLSEVGVSLHIRKKRDSPKHWEQSAGRESKLAPELETAADGRVRFTAPSWNDVLQYSAHGSVHLREVSEYEFVVAVRAEGYRYVTQVVAPGTDFLRIGVHRASALVGSVTSENMESMRLSIAAYPTSSDLRLSGALSYDEVHFSNASEEFRLEQLPTGFVDVYIMWAGESLGYFAGGATWPALTLRGIEVRAGVTGAPPALQNIPFDQLARWVVVDLGSAAREIELGSVAITLADPAHPEQVRTAEVKVVDGIVRVPLPIGVASWTGTIDSGATGKSEVHGLGPGRHRVELEQRQSIELRFSRTPQRNGWTLGVGGDPGLAAFSRGTVFDVSSERMVTWVDGPGTVHCEWAAFDEEKGLVLIKGKFEITEADIERGYVVITPPDGF